jgi:hypothetical protein
VARQHHHEQTAGAEPKERIMKRADSPFPRHWLYYLILKYVVIAAAAIVALYAVYRLYSS